MTTETDAKQQAAGGNNGTTTVNKSSSGMNPVLALSYLAIIATWGISQYVLIPYVAHLLILVTSILYAACHSSLSLREVPDPLSPDSTHSSASSEKETLRKEDAYQFPIIGSISLFSLYLAFKYLDKDWVNFIIGGYFALVGCVAVTMTISPALSLMLPKSFQKQLGWDYKVKHSMPEWVAGPSPLDLSMDFTTVDILSLCIAAVVCGLYIQNKTWYLNNVLGICFCLQGISKFSLGTYKIAAILLIGLFFYDIFWVFGTEVMVSYSFDIIIIARGRLLFAAAVLERSLSMNCISFSCAYIIDFIFLNRLRSQRIWTDQSKFYSPVH